MYIKIDLSDRAKEALINDEEWSGSCRIHFKKPKYRKKKYKKLVLSEIETEIISYWNEHPCMKNFESDERLNPITERDVTQQFLVEMKKAIDAFSPEGILDRIDAYFSVCAEGKHINKDRNIAYANLFGFLRKINEKDGELWWQKLHRTNYVEDQSPELTTMLADKYAKTVLGRSKFGVLGDLSSAREKFIMTVARCKQLSEALDTPIEEIMDHVIKCVCTKYEEVFPGHLCNDTTWKILLPQYFKRLYE